MESLVDWFFRNQSQIILVILWLVAVLMGRFFYSAGSDSPGHQSSEVLAEVLAEESPNFLPWSRLLRLLIQPFAKPTIWILIVVVMVPVTLYGWDKLIVAPPHTALTFPDSQCEPNQPLGTLIFLHGWNGDDDSTWKQFPRFVCEDERLASLRVISVGYPTYMVRRNLTVTELADWLYTSIEVHLDPPAGHDIYFLSHSMGGVVAREHTLLSDSERSHLKPRALISIGTPHNGAQIGKLASSLGISKELTTDLAPESSFIKGQQVRWGHLNQRPATHCFSSPQDEVVSQQSAFFSCDKTTRYKQWGHSELVKPLSRRDDRYAFPISTLIEVVMDEVEAI